MPAKLTLPLTDPQRQELLRLRNTAPHPYVRERAGALRKIAAGASVRAVALFGLTHPRQPETVGRWVRRYRAEGSAGLRDRPGRGRKPAFPPSGPR